MNLLRLREIFHRASAMAPGERTTFLDESCGGNAVLRAEAEALLAAAERAGPFLSEPTLRTAGEAIGDNGPLPCSSIGAYQLLQKLGEGAYGEVFLAEQSEPVRRRVALKMLKAGLDSKQVLARFEAERQTLAMMAHSGIARVFDAGMTPQGRPYFVMEFVDGVPVTDFCMLRRIAPRERLELFCEICRAVQHAHMRGVIHRDLKPSNILVTEADGHPRAVVIDFGIAKAMRGVDARATLHTGLRQLMGTPAYMSPEQAGLGGPDVDTRSDVYSLGVLLYELLTGVTPLDAAQLKAAALAELQRRISEEVPPRPSTRVASLTASRTQTGLRAEFAAPVRLLKGDLDWIVMKALEKEPERRYASAAAFADDVTRHLDNLPVSVGPPSFWYGLRKFSRRHRAGVAAAAIALLALCSGLSLALYGLQQARREAAAKEIQRQRAERVIAVLNRAFASANPITAKGGNYTLRSLLDDFTRDFDASTPLEPEVEISLRQTVGRAYQSLAEYPAAGRQYEAGLALAEQHAPPLRSSLLADLGWLLRDLGRYEAARERFSEALAGMAPEAPDRALTEARLAEVWHQLGHDDRALAAARQALQRPADRASQLPILQQASVVLLGCGAVDEAADCSRRALGLAEAQSGPESPRTIEPLLAVADTLRRQGRAGEAEATALTALQRAENSLGADHPITLMVRGRLAEMREANNVDQGAAAHREVFEALLKKLGADHPRTMEELIRLCLSTTAAALPEDSPQPKNSSTRLSEISGKGMTELIETLRKNDRLAEFEVVVRRGMEEAARRPGSARIALELESVYFFIRLVGGHFDEAHDGFVRLIAKARETMSAGENFVVALHLLRAMASEHHRLPDLHEATHGLAEVLAARPPGDFQTLRYLNQLRHLHERNHNLAAELETIDAGLKSLPPVSFFPAEYRNRVLLGRAALLMRTGATEIALADIRMAFTEALKKDREPDKLLLAAATRRAEAEADSVHWAAMQDWLPALLERIPSSQEPAAAELRTHWQKCQERLRAESLPPPEALREPDFARLTEEVESLWRMNTAESRSALTKIGRRFFAWNRGPEWRELTIAMEDRRLQLPPGQRLIAPDTFWHARASGQPPSDWPSPAKIDGAWHTIPSPFAAGVPVFHRATMAPPSGQDAGAPVYLCHFFQVNQPEKWRRLKIRSVMAGGGTVWLNGRELPLPKPAGTDIFEEAVLPETLLMDAVGWLRNGQNLLSAQVRPADSARPRWVFELSVEALEP
jgi:serine/threonine protein kinase